MSIICCIGSGNMGVALMNGAVNDGADSSNIFFTDADMQKAQDAAESLKAQVLKTNTEAVEKGDFVFLAVKPQGLQSVLAEIAPAVLKRATDQNPPVLVSMAAGWSIAKIQSILKACVPVIRIMPNTPALIGKGMIAYASSPEVTAEKNAELEKLLGGAGIVDPIEEKYLDSVTGLSGSGPAYVYHFIEALAEGGTHVGLPKEKALNYAAQTVLGAASMVLKTEKPPHELIDMVTSPGGTTIAGLSALKSGTFKESIIKAVEAAWKRAMELG